MATQQSIVSKYANMPQLVSVHPLSVCQVTPHSSKAEYMCDAGPV